MIIGITGGSGCGKTTLLECIRDRGGLVFDADAVYHRLLEEDTELLGRIRARFPEAFEKGCLNRKKLGSLVFQDPEALRELNAITHSAVAEHILQQIRQEQPALAAIDAIALFEAGMDRHCDVTAAVTAPREQRIRRLILRDGIDRSYAEARIDAQHSEDWFRQRCSHILENDGSREAFREKCLAFLDTILL